MYKFTIMSKLGKTKKNTLYFYLKIMMNDYFIKKYNEKRISSSKTQDFFLKKKKIWEKEGWAQKKII